MSNQIFKNKISNDVFFEFLNSICLKNEKYLILNIEAFKKGVYNNKVIDYSLAASTPAASKRRRREATQEVEKYPGKNTGKKEKVRLCK